MSSDPYETALSSGGDIAGGWPNSPTCPLEGTTTVYVTVPASSPVNSPYGSSQYGSSLEQTIRKTHTSTKIIHLSAVHPTEGEQSSGVVAASSALGAQTSGNIFTTLTIDIWGTGGDPGQSSATGSALPPDYTGSPASSQSFPEGTPVTSDGSAQSSTPDQGSTWPEIESYGVPDNGGSSIGGGTPASSESGVQSPEGNSPWYTVVTDTDVHWIPGETGPVQTTLLTQHTLTVGEGTLGTSGIGGPGQASPSCITIIGSDGEPTVIDVGSGDSGQTAASADGQGSNGGSPATLPTPTPTFFSDGKPQNGASGPGYTTCVTYTITGADGSPTVVESS